MTHIVDKIFGEGNVRFRNDGWFCATDAAKMFGYRLDNWLRYEKNKTIMTAVYRSLESRDRTSTEYSDAKNALVSTVNGDNGATWMHPSLAPHFAMAIDPDFGVWVGQQIQHILLEERDQVDWGAARFRTKEANKVRNSTIAQTRKPTNSAEYVKASRELWYLQSGAFKSVDRDSLSEVQLTLLERLELSQSYLLEALPGVSMRAVRPLLEDRANNIRQELGLEPLDY